MNTRDLMLPGKITDKPFLDRFAEKMLGEPCDCGCGRSGEQRAHILRGAKRTDEPWNLAWLNSECHREFDSAGEASRVWMFDRLIQLGRCSAKHVLHAQRRFGIDYGDL